MASPILVEIIYLGQAREYNSPSSPILPIISSSSEYPVGSKVFAVSNGINYIAIEDKKEPVCKTLISKKLNTTTYSTEVEVGISVDVKGNVINSYITANDWAYGDKEPARLRCEVFDLYNPPPGPKFTFTLERQYTGGFKDYTVDGCPIYSYDSGYPSHYQYPLQSAGSWGIVNSYTWSTPQPGTNRIIKRVRMYNATWITWWPNTKEGPTGDWELQRYPNEPDNSKRVWGMYWGGYPSPFSLNWRNPYVGIPCWSEHGGVKSYMIAYPEGIAP